MVSGNDGVGGLIGDNNGNKLFNSYAGGSVSGNNNVGGLVGSIDKNTITNTRGFLHNNYASGSVSGNNNNVGGLIGSYNNGIETFSDNYASGSVMGQDSIGGLIGTPFLATDASDTINNSYASGSVMGQGNIGSFIGRSIGRLVNSYADRTKNPNLRLEGSVAGTLTNSSTRTTVEMQAGRGQSTTRKRNLLSME